MKSRRRITAREPEHHEAGYRGSMSSHMSHNSPASKGASMGAGPLPGAGELNPPGAFPGPAAARVRGVSKAETPNYPTPPGTAPRGMKVYNEE